MPEAAKWSGADDALRIVNDRRLMYRHKWPYVWQWFLNLNFYAGNQWVRWDPALKKVVLDPQDPDKHRVVENKIQPIVRQAIGRVLRQQLKQICPPDAKDEAAVDKAKVRSQLLEHLRRTTNTDQKQKAALTWAALTGNGFTRYWWDEDAGPKKKNGKPMGDVAVDVISPYSIIVPPNCLSIDEMPWIMEVTTRSVAWVYERHGIEVASDAAPNAFDQFDARVLDYTSGGAFINNQPDIDTYTDTQKGDRKTLSGAACNYVMYWERPTEANENGRLIIVAGGKVVYPTTDAEAEDGILPHSPSGDLPYNHLRWFDSGFRFWDMGVVEMMVPLQRERNLLASMILDALRYTVRAGWLAPNGSLKKDVINSESGSITFYTPVGGLKPEPMTPQSVNAQYFQRIAMIDQDMADIAGIHSRPPAGVRAAAAFALQQESDNTLAEPIVENVNAWLVRDGQLKLRLAKAHYGRGRTIRVAGGNLRWEVTEFDATDMGDSDDVEIQGSGQLAQDKVQRLDQVMKLITMKDAKGEPIIDAYEARRLLDLENSENIDSQIKADINRARWENEQMDAGKPITVNRWDNHDAHLREHYTRMKRLDFDELPPAAREQYMLHTMAHEQAKASVGGAAQGASQPMAAPGQSQVQAMTPSSQLAQQVLPQGAPSLQVAAGLQSGLSAVSNVVAQANA